ncbi:MAG TPA: hypothetical protein VIT02_10020 [Burkholderiaceae bacterium]
MNPQPTGVAPAADPHVRTPRRSAAAVAIGLAIASTLLATLPGCGSPRSAIPGLPASAEQAAASRYEVEVRDMAWSDASREREIPVRLYLPRSDRPVPIVVFSHGLGGSRFGYSHLGQHWAANGIAALHLQHPGSDREVWRSQGLAVVSAMLSAATTENAIARAADVSFVIDRIVGDKELRSLIDPSRIGVAGHSFGANTALLASGARFRLDDQVVSYGDARVRAAVILSAPSLPPDQDPWFVYTPISVPTLHLTGTRDTIALPVVGSAPDERRVPFDSMVSGPRYLGVFEDGRHTMFNDRSRDATSQAIKASTRAITLAFWRAVLLGDSASRALLAAPALSGASAPLATWESRR